MSHSVTTILRADEDRTLQIFEDTKHIWAEAHVHSCLERFLLEHRWMSWWTCLRRVGGLLEYPLWETFEPIAWNPCDLPGTWRSLDVLGWDWT